MRNVPKLRFKEFIDEWEENNILELCSMKARIGWQNLRKEEHLDEGEFYLVTGTDFYLERIKWETAKYVPEERYSQDKNIILKEGDILITKDGSIGKLAFVENIGNKKATLNNGIFRIRIEKSEQFSKYLFYTFLSDRFKNFLKQLTAGSTIVHLYQKDFEKYKVAYPNFKEQQKIANFLSSVDKKISIAEEKLNLFNEYKKGIMQKIFNQELRFKDKNGNDYPEWEEKYLGEIGEIITGKTPSTKDEKNWNGNLHFVTPTDINDNKYQKSTQRKVSENIKTKILPIGTIMFTCIASIGKMAISTEKCITNQQINSIVVNKDIYNEYIYYILLNLVPKIQASQSTTTLPIINKTEFSRFVINLPCLEEQKKIANFLSAIDTKIEKISYELENLKEFKKGLLQQVFV